MLVTEFLFNEWKQFKRDKNILAVYSFFQEEFEWC